MKNRLILLLSIALLLAVTGGGRRLSLDTLAQSSENTSTALRTGYDLTWRVIGGAGDQFIAGGNYQMGFTLAQDTPPMINSGGEYQVVQGFWYDDDFEIYLPLVIREQ